jgi:hypothetical protein
MKRWIILIVLVVTLSAAGTVLLQYLPEATAGREGGFELPLKPRNVNGPQPKLAFTAGGDLTYEVGTMAQRQTGKHTWTVKNEGQADLVLHQESSTCSCTIAKFKNGEDAVLKPGESTDINLEFETREFKDDHSWGATIGTNDPERPSFTLQAHGKVYPAVMTFPPEPVINLQTLSNDEDDHKVNVAVYSKDRPETKIVKITTSNKQVEAIHEPISEKEAKTLPGEITKGEKVTINVKSGLPLGVFKEEVVITTDHPNQPEVRVGVGGKMVGAINLLPSVLSMHDVNAKTGGTGGVTVVVRGNRATTFKVVKKPEPLQVEVTPATAGKPGRYRLSVTVPPDTSPRRIEDEIVLETDHPKAAKVIVPLSVWVRDAN